MSLSLKCHKKCEQKSVNLRVLMNIYHLLHIITPNLKVCLMSSLYLVESISCITITVLVLLFSCVGPHESHPIREYMFRANGKNTSPVNIFLFKVSNRNTRNRCKMCSNLTVKTAEPRQWRRSDLCRSLLTLSILTPFFNVFIVEFEQVNVWCEVNVSPHFPAFELNIEFIDKLWARKNSEFEYFSHNTVSLTSLSCIYC